jgi:hypothetical protein
MDGRARSGDSQQRHVRRRARELRRYVGFLSTFFAMDIAATSAATQELLGWTPNGPTLVQDIDAGAYG